LNAKGEKLKLPIEELKTSSENLNTRKSTNQLWVGVFKKWAALRTSAKTWKAYRRFKNLTSLQLTYE
jgi:hypothetical protein